MSDETINASLANIRAAQAQLHVILARCSDVEKAWLRQELKALLKLLEDFEKMLTEKDLVEHA